ncbi:hypothetical protein FGB62_261g019 [Gracilaria domingensis]|nr:hypothetical protein FGB62_261g019 [Gracilaria domingensis]
MCTSWRNDGSGWTGGQKFYIEGVLGKDSNERGRHERRNVFGYRSFIKAWSRAWKSAGRLILSIDIHDVYCIWYSSRRLTSDARSARCHEGEIVESALRLGHVDANAGGLKAVLQCGELWYANAMRDSLAVSGPREQRFTFCHFVFTKEGHDVIRDNFSFSVNCVTSDLRNLKQPFELRFRIFSWSTM